MRTGSLLALAPMLINEMTSQLIDRRGAASRNAAIFLGCRGGAVFAIRDGLGEPTETETGIGQRRSSMMDLVLWAAGSWRTYQGWVIGGVLVGLNSYARFNTPPNSRSSTTWGRYHTLALAYTLASLVVWITLGTAPDLFPLLGKLAGFAPETARLAAPLYAALLIIVLVGVKPFSAVDRRIRAFLQDLARIPWEAQRLSAALRGKTWWPNTSLQDRVRAALHDGELNDCDVSFAGDRTPAALWTKITAMHLHVRGWEENDSRFAGFYGRHRAEFQHVHAEFEALQDSTRRHFRVMRSLASISTAPQIEEACAELTRHFVEAATRLEKAICDLVSRALLSCALTENARRAELEAMGFVVNVGSTRLFDRMLGLYLVLAGLFIAVITWNGRPKPVLAGAIIATIYMGAVLAALYPKQWAWAAPNDGGRSIKAYTLSAILAAGFSLAASFGLGALLTFDSKTAFQLLVGRWWPWAFSAAATAFLIACLADNRDRPRLRWLEAAIQGAGSALAAAIVWRLLNNLCPGGELDCSPPLERVVMTNAICGAIIGFFVPTWYRRPQTMALEYRKWKVRIATRVGDSGRVSTAIELVPPATSPQRSSTLVPEEVYPSAEEAIAASMAQARRWVDRSYDDAWTASAAPDVLVAAPRG